MPPRLTLVLCLAFCLRCAVFVTAWFSLRDHTAFYAKDTWSYLQPALELLSAGTFTAHGTPELFRTPGYPVLLCLGVLARHVEVVTIALQILLGCLTTYLVFRIAHELFHDARVATFSALAYSLEPLSIISSSWLLSDTLFTALLAAALFFLLKFARRRRLPDLTFSSITLTATAYVRPIGYLLPLALTLVLFVWAIMRRERKLALQAFAFCAIAFVLLGAWQLRNYTATGYAGFSAAVDYNLYFHQIAALKAREQQLPFYQVLDDMGFYSREKYLRHHPEQQSWTVAEQYEFMRSAGLQATLREPATATDIYLHGLLITMFDPGASEYLRLFRLYPKSGKLLNTVVSEGIVTAAINLITQNPLLSTLTLLFGLLLLTYYALAFLGLKVMPRSLSLWLLLTTGIYLLACSGGTIASGRFRIPLMLLVCILAGQGLSLAWQKLRQPRFAPNFDWSEANWTRH
jgi:hypothetical protein